jgi:glyoxylase-like metal-dependent hydrolase (beta-lactamase superfamily II)
MGPDAGIHRLSIPTPFAVGRVNAYLIEDDPLTLLDTGPNSARSLDELEAALAVHGRRVEDLGLVVVTHQHMDHEGLVAIVARRAGADVAALDLLAPYLSAYSASLDADDDLATAVMRAHGIPEDVVLALRSVAGAFHGWGAACEVTRELTDGGELRLRDRTFRVHHRPGHSPSDTILHDEASGVVLGGDHLIGHISSNPLISRPLDGTVLAEGERPRALPTYLASLRATQAMDGVAVVLPGHGDPVEDPGTLIEDRFRMHARRADKIARLLEERPLTAYEVAQTMWGNVAVTQAYLTLSEVLGHVDLLAADGRVREAPGDDGIVRLERVGGG